jgi:chromate transporter
MAIHLGWRRAGWAGLVVAGVCFIAPAALLVGALAWVYLRFGALPRGVGLLAAVKPVVVVVVAQALWRFARTALKTPSTIAVAAACVGSALLGAHELLILLGAGAVCAAARAGGMRAWVPLFAASSAALPLSLGGIFLAFLKIGSVLFGSGYVLLAFLRADLVERWHWLSEAQLLDAVAVGQLTPGPVLTTATFIGFVLRGPLGAAAATIAIFLPAFVFVALAGPLVPRLRASRAAGAFLDGVNAASVALMGVVTVELGRAAFAGWRSFAFAGLASLGLVLKINSAWLILAAAIAGLFL